MSHKSCLWGAAPKSGGFCAFLRSIYLLCTHPEISQNFCPVYDLNQPVKQNYNVLKQKKCSNSVVQYQLEQNAIELILIQWHQCISSISASAATAHKRHQRINITSASAVSAVSAHQQHQRISSISSISASATSANQQHQRIRPSVHQQYQQYEQHQPY